MLISLSTAMVAVLLLLLRASPASATCNTVGGCPQTPPPNCLQNEFNFEGGTQNLNCTANDVRVAEVTNVRDLNGKTLSSCISGSSFNFIADFKVVTSSTSSRSNIGLYFALNPTQVGGALTGSCSDNIIPPAPYTCPGSNVICDTTTHDEFDPSPDNCGDSSSSDPNATQIVTIEVNNFSCTAPAGTNTLVLPNCTSWQVPGKTIQCQSAAPNYPYVTAAVPGSPSKCNCGTIPLPITVQSPMASVVKTCDVGASPNIDINPNALCTGAGAPFACCTAAGAGSGTGACGATSCSLNPEGGPVTYTVTITNSSNFGNIIVDQICDSAYGTVFRAGAPFSGPACATGTTGSSITSTTCNALSIPGTTPPTSASCTFTASQPEAKTVTDIVSATGHGASAGTFGPDNSNSVTVVSHEAPSKATISKQFSSTTTGCVTVRYNVSVSNTSTLDENLSLTALDDGATYGDITMLHGSGDNAVLGTTCGVATGSPGLGTLNLSTGGGTLPQTLTVGGSAYSCQFDGQICGTLSTIPNGSGGQCRGLAKTDTLTGTLVPDPTTEPGETNGVTVTPGTVTIDECFSL